MADRNWIGIGTAHDELIEVKSAFYERHQVLEHRSTWLHLLEDLMSGQLPSQPSDPADYELIFAAGDEAKSIPLNPDGTLPYDFWYYFAEADKRQRRELPTLCKDEAFSSEKNTYFTCTSLAKEGVMTGRAGKVLVLRSALEGLLPPLSGRRPGAGKFVQIDAGIVELVVHDYLAGKFCKKAEAIRWHLQATSEWPDTRSEKQHYERIRKKVSNKLRMLGIK